MEWLRADAGRLPRLSLVAVDVAEGGGAVIGHVVCGRGAVDGRPALGLGPQSASPDRQRTGVGSALRHAVLGAADALDEPLAALLGEPAYDARFGFRPAADHGITAPDPAWGDDVLVRALSAHDPSVAGTFAHAAPFDRR